MAQAAPLPADQRGRINRLRIAIALALPAIAFTRPGAPFPEWAMEAIESLGILLIVAGVLGRFWSVLYIGGRKNAEVMRVGPYSMVRHPLYVFSTIAALGFGLMLGSVVATALVAGSVFWILRDIATKEERFLAAAFGPAWDRYAAVTPRLWPKISLFQTPSTATFEVSTLRRNLRDAFVLLSLIPIGEFLEHYKALEAWPTIPLP
jgi:protein-S-isoprenylcysteine O-methyltransferase Ste14